MRILILAGALLVTLSAVAVAQEDCDWDTCALMIKSGGFSPGLVAGVEETKVEGMGMFPSRDLIDFFAERSEPAAAHFRTYRSRQATGSGMFWGGLVVLIAGAAVAAETESGAGAIVGLGGLAVSFTGAAVMGTAPDHLSRAVWDYNRTFAEGDLPDVP